MNHPLEEGPVVRQRAAPRAAARNSGAEGALRRDTSVSSRNCALISVSAIGGLEQPVSCSGVTLDQLGDPFAVGAPDGRVGADCGGQVRERSFAGEVLLLQPLQDRPVLQHVVRRRHE